MRILQYALRASVLAGALALASPVLADGAEDYSYYRTAQTLDDTCHVLKFVERKVVDRVAFDGIRTTTQYSFWETGRWEHEEYTAWLDGLDAAADAKALELGCTAAAEPYLLKARGLASGEILQGLMLAHHLAKLPEDDTYRRPLHPETMAAAGTYQGFLQQVYADQYQAFHQYQGQQAAARLPAKNGSGCDLFDPSALCLPDWNFVTDEAYYEKMGAATTAALVADDVQFEVAAETAGYRVVGGWVQKVHLAAHLMDPRTGSLFATLLDGTRRYRLQGGGEVFGAIGQAPDGTLRFMTYGLDAEQLRSGAVRLLVRSEPKPEGMADWQVFNLVDYRSLTFPFDGTLLDERCLGGPCFGFSAQATEAILATGFDERAELWLAADASAAPAATADWLERNMVFPQLIRRLRGETPPAQ